MAFPENAARALGKVAGYATWRARTPGLFWSFSDIHPDDARAMCREIVEGRGEDWLTDEELRRVMSAFGLPIVLARNAGDAADGVIVEPMSADGTEVIVGLLDDPLFGPLVGVGLGGVNVEALSDVHFRIAPLTDHDADELLHEMRGFALLDGYRGRPRADVEALTEVVLRVSRMAEEIPEIVELDLNPVIVLDAGKGCRIVHARMKVRKAGAVACPLAEVRSARSHIAGRCCGRGGMENGLFEAVDFRGDRERPRGSVLPTEGCGADRGTAAKVPPAARPRTLCGGSRRP